MTDTYVLEERPAWRRPASIYPDPLARARTPEVRSTLEELSSEYAALRTTIDVAEACDVSWPMQVTVGGRAFTLATTALLPVLRTRLEELRTQLVKELR